MRVLVTAASKHTATTGIATAIAEEMTAASIETIVASPESVQSLEGYDGVVLGSAVYAGHWLGSAKQFVDRHATALATLPVWLFSSGPLGEPLKPDGESDDVETIVRRLGARSHQVFGGRLERKHLSLGERAIVGIVRAPDGDYRPWDKIRAWSAEITQDLTAPR